MQTINFESMKFKPQDSAENNRAGADEFSSDYDEGLTCNNTRIGNHLKVSNKISIHGVDHLDLEYADDNNEIKNMQVKYSLIMNHKKMIETLLDAGYRCNLAKAKTIVETYLANYEKHTQGYDPANNKISAIQTGWHHTDYVLPNLTIAIGEPSYKFFPVAESADLMHSIVMAGTLGEWQENVAMHCVGRPLLEIGLYAAFCAPLVRWCGATYGFHFYGPSSIGKSTIMEAASSVYGHPKQYMNKWDATSPGMEMKAANSNHVLLILDELNQAKPDSFRSVYQIIDGKGRARKTEQTRRWQTVLLSSGEVSTEIYAKQMKIALKAGELVRLVNIEAIKVTDDQEHSNQIKQSSAKYHGTAIVQFIQELQNEFGMNLELGLKSIYSKKLETFTAMLKALNIDNPQAYRVAEYFALCIIAGELAIKYEVLPQGFEPTKSCIQVFKKWLEDNSKTGEEKAIINYFKDAIGEPRNFVPRNEYLKLGAAGLGYYIEDGETNKIYYMIPKRIESIGFYVTLKLDPNLAWKAMIKLKLISSLTPELVAVGTGKLYLIKLNLDALK